MCAGSAGRHVTGLLALCAPWTCPEDDLMRETSCAATSRWQVRRAVALAPCAPSQAQSIHSSLLLFSLVAALVWRLWHDKVVALFFVAKPGPLRAQWFGRRRHAERKTHKLLFPLGLDTGQSAGFPWAHAHSLVLQEVQCNWVVLLTTAPCSVSTASFYVGPDTVAMSGLTDGLCSSSHK